MTRLTLITSHDASVSGSSCCQVVVVMRSYVIGMKGMDLCRSNIIIIVVSPLILVRLSVWVAVMVQEESLLSCWTIRPLLEKWSPQMKEGELAVVMRGLAPWMIEIITSMKVNGGVKSGWHVRKSTLTRIGGIITHKLTTYIYY